MRITTLELANLELAKRAYMAYVKVVAKEYPTQSFQDLSQTIKDGWVAATQDIEEFIMVDSAAYQRARDE